MTQDLKNVNPMMIAPLENINLFTEVVNQLESRDPGMPGFATFYGPSGFGKTRSATSAYMRLRCPMVIADDFTTRKSLLENIVTELQIPIPPRSTANSLVKLIIDEFRTKDFPLLILDEVDYLVDKNLIDGIRSIQNKVPELSCIMIGEELLPHKLRKWERIDGRVLVHQAAAPCSVDDTIKLMDLHCPEIIIAEDLAQEILKVSAGSARRTVTNLLKVRETALNNSQDQIDLNSFEELSPTGLSTRDVPKARKF